MSTLHFLTRLLNANARADGSIRLVALLALGLFFGANTRGSTFQIIQTGDSAAATSLRGAILAANHFGGNNTIRLGPVGSFNLARMTPYVYHLTRAEPQVFGSSLSQNLAAAEESLGLVGELKVTRGHLTIIGSGSNVVIDATGLGDRIFNVFSNAQLTLSNVTLSAGTAPAGRVFFYPYVPFSVVPSESGGAIYNAGTVVLNNCTITNNISGGGSFDFWFGSACGNGGGICNYGTLVMSGCTVSGNAGAMGGISTTGGSGGGLANYGTAALMNCVITGNQSGSGDLGADVDSGGSGGNGGGILNAGSLVVTNCIISNNLSGTGADGGWLVFYGSFPGDSINLPIGSGGAGGAGAGIFNSGQMRLYDSTVANNTGGTGGTGNGIYQEYSGYELTGQGGSGAGIFNVGNLVVNTCTISGNTCGVGGDGSTGFNGATPGGPGGSGGGIYNLGSLVVTSSTIVSNLAAAGGNGGTNGTVDLIDPPSLPYGGNGGSGGGIMSAAVGTNVVVHNTLIAWNAVSPAGQDGTNFDMDGNVIPYDTSANLDGTGPDLAGAFTSAGFNLVSMADGSVGLANGISDDQLGSIALPLDPLLGPLRFNGGFTPTCALLPGSPAINQGNSFGIHTDQRGHHRPYLYPDIPNAPGGDGSDIGAYELDSVPPPP